MGVLFKSVKVPWCDVRIEIAKHQTADVTEQRYWTFQKDKRSVKKARETAWEIEENCQQGVDNFLSFFLT